MRWLTPCLLAAALAAQAPVLAAPAPTPPPPAPLTGASLPSFGEESVFDPGQPTPAPPPPAAPSPAVTAAQAAQAKARLALAERHFDLLGMQDRLAELIAERFVAVVDDHVAALGPASGPTAAQSMKDAAAEALDAAIEPKAADWKAAVAAVIADTYTTEELTVLNAFYETPTGKSIAAKASAFSVRLTETAPTMLPAAGPLAADILDRYCAKTRCRP